MTQKIRLGDINPGHTRAEIGPLNKLGNIEPAASHSQESAEGLLRRKIRELDQRLMRARDNPSLADLLVVSEQQATLIKALTDIVFASSVNHDEVAMSIIEQNFKVIRWTRAIALLALLGVAGLVFAYLRKN